MTGQKLALGKAFPNLVNRILADAQASPAITEMPARSAAELAAMIDHTLLKPEADRRMLARLCNEALRYGFASVCINPANVPYCSQILRESAVKVCSVTGFPLGAARTRIKVAEAKLGIRDGAAEIDMVMNIGLLKDGLYHACRRDMLDVVRACHDNGALLKIILETCLLSDQEKTAACLLALDAGADFVKTSTGLSSGGATVPDVSLMRAVVGNDMGVKAAGGIRDLPSALAMIAAGANRIGTSAGVAIVSSLVAEG